MTDFIVDPKLATWATPRQAEYIDAVNLHGGVNAAASALATHPSTVGKAISSVREKAARGGYAPGHWQDGVAPGYLMGKVTVQRGPAGVERTWERMSPDQEAYALAQRAALEALAEELPRVRPLQGPALLSTNERLLNLYTLTDSHVGMLAWHKEGGADWDLKIAENVLVGCFAQMIAGSPPARVGFVNQLGDFLHSDGLLPITPTSGHILDQDGRFSKMVGVAIRVLRRVVDMSLAKHESVVVLLAEGNHDMASSVWLRHMFKALYENEPRVHVIDSELPFYAYQHGKTALFFHHGHLKKPETFVGVFAPQFPVIWGATTKRYAHAGHRHHWTGKDDQGLRVIQHSTLAARDAYAARGAWFSEREATSYTYHDDYGQVASNTVSPEMLI